ncbi:MAG: hypothetical protein LAO07_18245, partial [Acidobacteriia bacterium]|nr:hypothetical protein [Terriglobia bacterium]
MGLRYEGSSEFSILLILVRRRGAGTPTLTDSRCEGETSMAKAKQITAWVESTPGQLGRIAKAL